MARSIPIIGLSPDEIPWVRKLVTLLRHPDPTVPELARQALLYLARAADNSLSSRRSAARLAKTPPCYIAENEGADPLPGSR